MARGLQRKLGAATPAQGCNGFAFGWLTGDQQACVDRVKPTFVLCGRHYGGAHER